MGFMPDPKDEDALQQNGFHACGADDPNGTLGRLKFWHKFEWGVTLVNDPSRAPRPKQRDEPWSIGIVQWVLFHSMKIKYHGLEAFPPDIWTSPVLDSVSKVRPPFVADRVMAVDPITGEATTPLFIPYWDIMYGSSGMASVIQLQIDPGVGPIRIEMKSLRLRHIDQPSTELPAFYRGHPIESLERIDAFQFMVMAMPTGELGKAITVAHSPEFTLMTAAFFQPSELKAILSASNNHLCTIHDGVVTQLLRNEPTSNRPLKPQIGPDPRRKLTVRLGQETGQQKLKAWIESIGQ